ncbi:MAG: RDD family protein [Candidatus Asgardarchaeia archaeon]
MVEAGVSEYAYQPSYKKIRLADWGSRFLAWFIDIVIVEIILDLFFMTPPFFIHPGAFMQYFGIKSSVMFLCWTLFEGNGGQSIGKMALNIKVTDLVR